MKNIILGQSYKRWKRAGKHQFCSSWIWHVKFLAWKNSVVCLKFLYHDFMVFSINFELEELVNFSKMSIFNRICQFWITVTFWHKWPIPFLMSLKVNSICTEFMDIWIIIQLVMVFEQDFITKTVNKVTIIMNKCLGIMFQNLHFVPNSIKPAEIISLWNVSVNYSSACH